MQNNSVQSEVAQLKPRLTRSEKIELTSEIVESVLQMVTTGSTIIASLAVPGLAKIFERPLTNWMSSSQRRKETKRILKYMHSRKLIKLDELPDGSYRLTIHSDGRKRIKKMNFARLTIAKPAKLDGRWRVVIFDIPESYQSARAGFRQKLKEIGLTQVQKSVWMHPFPCLEEITAVTEYYGITKYVTYFEAVNLDPDTREILLARFHHLVTA